MRPQCALLAVLTSIAVTAAGGALQGSEAIRQAVVDVALERAPSSAELVAIETARTADPTGFLAANPSPGPLSTLVVPRVPLSRNPYATQLVSGAQAFLGRTEAPWPIVTADSTPFVLDSSKENDSRGTAGRMDALLWLFASPGSPLRHDPRVLTRLLRRVHVVVDTILLQPGTRPGTGIYDDFALAPALLVLRELSALYPGVLLPYQRQRLDEAMRVAGTKVLGHSLDHRARHPKGYANIDLLIAVQLHHAGTHLGDAAMLEASRQLLARVEADILPDGGTHYIWSQNESQGYHDVIANYFARLHETTGDPSFLALLRRLEWYGPVSVGRLAEYWTAPSWKQLWNTPLRGGAGTGGEAVVGATGNPWARALVIPPTGSNTGLNWHRVRDPIAWYRDDITPCELPANYVILDRNIAGPRLWQGRFTTAATLRTIPTDEPGHPTLIGAQLATEAWGIDTILMGVGPRVYLEGDRGNARSFAALTSGLTSTLRLGRTWFAFHATHGLHAFASSSRGAEVPWNGRQLWLGLPDRLVGVVDIAPAASDTPPARPEGLVRLGVGGTVTGIDKPLVHEGGTRFRMGNLVVILHCHGFGQVRIEQSPFRVPAAPFRDLVLADAQPTSARRRFVVEIRPASTTTEAVVAVEGDVPVPTSFRIAVGAKVFTLLPGPANGLEVTVDSPDPEDQLPPWTGLAELLGVLPTVDPSP